MTLLQYNFQAVDEIEAKALIDGWRAQRGIGGKVLPGLVVALYQVDEPRLYNSELAAMGFRRVVIPPEEYYALGITEFAA